MESSRGPAKQLTQSKRCFNEANSMNGYPTSVEYTLVRHAKGSCFSVLKPLNLVVFWIE
jgi:hypothetical protein